MRMRHFDELAEKAKALATKENEILEAQLVVLQKHAETQLKQTQKLAIDNLMAEQKKAEESLTKEITTEEKNLPKKVKTIRSKFFFFFF